MTRTISPVSLIYSLLAGPVLWFAHFLLVWGMAEFGCRINFSNLEVVSPANIRLFILVTTIVALIAVAAGGMIAYGGWRRLRARDSNELVGNELVGEERLIFLMNLAMLLSGLFLFNIIVTTMPTFFLDICDLAI